MAVLPLAIGGLIGAAMGPLATVAQDRHADRQERLLERLVNAEERQARAMEDIAREVQRLRSGR